MPYYYYKLATKTRIFWPKIEQTRAKKLSFVPQWAQKNIQFMHKGIIVRQLFDILRRLCIIIERQVKQIYRINFLMQEIILFLLFFKAIQNLLEK